MLQQLAEKGMTHHIAALGPIRLHYVEMGAGRPVVLLHGFPEHWYSYRSQLPALAEAGFRAVAPDMRGYNLSDKPHGVGSYRSERVAADIARLIRSLGAEKATVVGHDWGGAIAWVFAMLYPELLDRLVILNAPHPLQMALALRHEPRQLLRSWYIFFFQIPKLPEQMLASRDFAMLRSQFGHDPVVPGAFSQEDIERYIEALRQPGALTASINYYRALLRFGLRDQSLWARPVRQPVMVIWGQHDHFLLPELATPPLDRAPNQRVVRLNASHWVQNDRPAEVNHSIIDFLKT